MRSQLHRAVRAALLVVVLSLAIGQWASAAFAKKPRGFGSGPPKKSKPGRPLEAEVVTGDAAIPRPPVEALERVQGPTVEPDSDAGSSLLSGRSSPLEAVIVGGGATGLWLALLLAVIMQGRVRVRVYEPRWERREDGALHWSAAAEESPHRYQVATIPGHVWSDLPSDVHQLVFPPDMFTEQWPSKRADREGAIEASGGPFPRNVFLGPLEDGLLEAVQLPIYADAIELFESAYDRNEHLRLGSDDRFHVIAAADGEAASHVIDNVLGVDFGRVLPRPGSQSIAETLAITFDLGLVDASSEDLAPLSIAASTVVSQAQRRFLVNWADSSHGTLYMRLTVAEAEELAEAVAGHAQQEQSDLRGLDYTSWLREGEGRLRTRVLEGLRLYGLPEEAVCRLDRHSCDGSLRPWFFNEVSDVETPSSNPALAFLVGDAAQSSSARFGPGFGPGADLEGVRSLANTLADPRQGTWWLGQWLAPLVLADHAAKMALVRDRGRQSACVGAEQCIEIGLARANNAGDVAEDTDREVFLESLHAALKKLASGHLSQERAVELPTWEVLQRHVRDANLAPETFSVFASTGPWIIEDSDGLEKSTPEVGTGQDVFDFGGETREGKAQAKQLEKAARAGDTEAQFQLGVMYFTANGVNKDGSMALKWLTRAADGGHVQAQNCVGSILRNGIDGLPEDKTQAAHWFRIAAERGELEAQYNLGEMYEEADGIDNDEVEAFRWYQSAAEGGLALAQLKAGLMLHAGNGVDKDVARAVPLITRAAEQGVAQALHVLGSLHYTGDGVVFDKVAAARYFTQAAEAGDPLAQYCIGVMLELGDGVDKDLDASQRWLQQASAQGVIEAQARCRNDRLLIDPTGA